MDVMRRHPGIKIFFALLVGGLFWYVNSVVLNALYNDSLPLYFYRESAILGKTKDEIIQKYGEPDFIYFGYCYKVNCPFSTQHYCYIEFDENGVAAEMGDACGYP